MLKQGILKYSSNNITSLLIPLFYAVQYFLILKQILYFQNSVGTYLIIYTIYYVSAIIAGIWIAIRNNAYQFYILFLIQIIGLGILVTTIQPLFYNLSLGSQLITATDHQRLQGIIFFLLVVFTPIPLSAFRKVIQDAKPSESFPLLGFSLFLGLVIILVMGKISIIAIIIIYVVTAILIGTSFAVRPKDKYLLTGLVIACCIGIMVINPFLTNRVVMSKLDDYNPTGNITRTLNLWHVYDRIETKNSGTITLIDGTIQDTGNSSAIEQYFLKTFPESFLYRPESFLVNHSATSRRKTKTEYYGYEDRTYLKLTAGHKLRANHFDNIYIYPNLIDKPEGDFDLVSFRPLWRNKNTQLSVVNKLISKTKNIGMIAVQFPDNDNSLLNTKILSALSSSFKYWFLLRYENNIYFYGSATIRAFEECHLIRNHLDKDYDANVSIQTGSNSQLPVL